MLEVSKLTVFRTSETKTKTNQMKNNIIAAVKSSLLCRVYGFLVKSNDRNNIDIKSDKKRSFKYILCPIHLTITDKSIEYRQRNWFLIGTERRTFHFQNITGIDIDKRLIGSDIAIFVAGNADILLSGFSKRNAEKIYTESNKYIHENTQRSLTDVMTEKIVGALGKNQSHSVADELTKLKGLLDTGAITNVEYDRQKQKLLY